MIWQNSVNPASSPPLSVRMVCRGVSSPESSKFRSRSLIVLSYPCSLHVASKDLDFCSSAPGVVVIVPF